MNAMTSGKGTAGQLNRLYHMQQPSAFINTPGGTLFRSRCRRCARPACNDKSDQSRHLGCMQPSKCAILGSDPLVWQIRSTLAVDLGSGLFMTPANASHRNMHRLQGSQPDRTCVRTPGLLLRGFFAFLTSCEPVCAGKQSCRPVACEWRPVKYLDLTR